MSINEKIMSAGHICLDITPSFSSSTSGDLSDILRPGKLVNVGNAVLSTGGSVANTGIAMSKTGVDVLLNGKVGDDAFGEIIRKLVGEKRSRAFKVVQGQSSSYSVVLAIEGIDRIFLHHTGTNDTFTSDDIDYQKAAECRLFHFGYPTLMRQMFTQDGSQLAKIFRKVRQAGTLTSLDMTLPDPNSESGKVDWACILEKTLPFVNIFMPSIEELAYMLDRDLFEQRKSQSKSDPVLAYTIEDCEKLSGKLLDMGVKIAAIKWGINGLFLNTAGSDDFHAISDKIDPALWADKQMLSPSFYSEKIASATGAGDATIAGFLVAAVRGYNPWQTLAIANSMGMQNLSKFDALSGIGTWQETLNIAFGSDRKQNQPSNINKNWTYNHQQRVYKFKN